MLFKKLTLTLAICALTVGVASAQNVVLEGISARSFTGIKSINGEFYYAVYFGEKTETKGMANFVLVLYDKDLNLVKKTELEVSKNSALSASSFSGKYFLFVFSDMNAKTRTTFTLDKEGNIVKKNEQGDIKVALLTPENTPDIHILSEEEFLVIQPEREKKIGYSISRMDYNQNVKWNKSYTPEKGSWSVEDSRISGDKLYILRKGKEALVGDKYTYAVHGFDLAVGADIYTTEIKDEEDGGFPNFISVKEDGTVATGGMYFAKGKYDEKNSDGLFFAILGADGKMNKLTKTSWKKIKDQIRGDFSSALVGGKTKVLIEDVIQKKDGTYMVIGETFRKGDADETGSGTISKLGKLGGGGSSSSSGSSSDKGFTIMDFAFFSFDANGELTAIDKVEKETKEAIIKGSMADMNGLELAQDLYRRKFFCYRSTIEVNGKQYIMYKNLEAFKTKAYFLPVGNTSVSGIGNIDMDKWLSEGLNKVGKVNKMLGNGNKTTFTSDQYSMESSNPELFKNIIPAKAGHVLLYEYTGGKMNIWLEPVPAI